jgi:hypothetical protein
MRSLCRFFRTVGQRARLPSYPKTWGPTGNDGATSFPASAAAAGRATGTAITIDADMITAPLAGGAIMPVGAAALAASGIATAL